MTSWKQKFVAAVLAAAIPTSLLTASIKSDLERITPVPDAEKIPAIDFLRPALLQQPMLNPSGTHIAAVISASEDNTSLMIYDLKAQSMETVGSRGDSDIVNPRWLTDNRLLYQINIQKLGSFIVAGAKVGALQAANPVLQNINGGLVSVPPNDRLHPLFAIGRGSEITGQYGQVVTLNAGRDTGTFIDYSNASWVGIDKAAEDNVRNITFKHPVLKTPKGFDLRYIADKDGKLCYAISSTDGILTLHRLEGETWLDCPENLDEIDVIDCGDNPGEIVVLGERKDNKPRALEIMEAATGKVLDVLVQDKAYDAQAWLYHDPVSHLIAGAVFDRAAPSVVWFSEAYRNLQKVVDGLFPGKIVRIIGNDEAGKMVLLAVSSDRQPVSYHWVDLEKRSAGLIKSSAPWIDPKRMQPMSVIKYKTRDGKQLDAFVTMPAGASKQNPPPLVVLASNFRVSWGFHATAQFLASRGYAVLQPNVRGEPGSSWMFPSAAEWDFGRMHEDVTDATKALIASDLVDRGRVGILGMGFGGFLALSGAAYDPDLYRCAISISGVADWGKAIADYRSSKFSSSYFTRMVAKIGDPSKDPEKWNAIAPLRHANEIRSAIFVVNGEYDAPIDIANTKELASIVSHNNIPVETATYRNEGDGVRHLANKVDLYTKIEDFLAKNLAVK